MTDLRNCTPHTARAIQHIRSLSDATVLAAARDSKSRAYALILAYTGPDTNRSWITAQCAEQAYLRDLIGEKEFDYLSD